jgi:transcription antitermination protein NusB
VQSRRNIRIKVMHGIYAYEQNAFTSDEVAVNNVKKSINAVYNIVLYNLLLLSEVSKYVLNEEIIRSKKHLPTDEDRNFSVKLSKNTVTSAISGSRTFESTIKQRKLNTIDNDEVARSLFKILYELKEYKLYSITEVSNTEHDREIIALLYKEVMLKSPVYDSHLEEIFPNLADDAQLARAITEDFINEFGKKPFDHFLNDLINTKEQEEFAAELFRRVLTENEFLQKLIEPHLENWEIERVAIIDMILMKMALAEILYFETIPVKVSLNEYIEISKVYSTPKSKDFINGILDKTMKTLIQSGKIQKSGRGLME